MPTPTVYRKAAAWLGRNPWVQGSCIAVLVVVVLVAFSVDGNPPKELVWVSIAAALLLTIARTFGAAEDEDPINSWIFAFVYDLFILGLIASLGSGILGLLT